jgi:DNA-binding CsgD family transcriptional regulator
MDDRGHRAETRQVARLPVVPGRSEENMPALLLRESEQAAIRAVIASEPVRGAALPGEGVLQHVSRLIECDAIGIALVDGTGSLVSDIDLNHDPGRAYDPRAGGSGTLGIRHLRRSPLPDGSGLRGVEVLVLGVRNGPDHVMQLWMVRRTRCFTSRDTAALALVAPALERLRCERPASTQSSLTVQERRVLHHVAAGLSNAEVASRLVVEPCTVRKHLENAYRKLGVTNRMAAVSAIRDTARGDSGHGPDRVTVSR